MAQNRRQHSRREPRTGRPARRPDHSKRPAQPRRPDHSKRPAQPRGRDHPNRPDLKTAADPGNTGSEAAYLKSLVESRATVTVVLKTGEHLQGRIRYYDIDCFSLGPSEGGPKIFLRKESVSYIAEGVRP